MSQLKRLIRVGVVRAMVASDHWHWVSMPRWMRASWKVTSTSQRCRYAVRMAAGFQSGLVQSRAWGFRHRQQRGLTGSHDPRPPPLSRPAGRGRQGNGCRSRAGPDSVKGDGAVAGRGIGAACAESWWERG